MVEIKQRVRLVGACYKRFGSELYDAMIARLSLKVRLLEAEMYESLQWGGVTWTLNATHSL